VISTNSSEMLVQLGPDHNANSGISEDFFNFEIGAVKTILLITQ